MIRQDMPNRADMSRLFLTNLVLLKSRISRDWLTQNVSKRGHCGHFSSCLSTDILNSATDKRMRSSKKIVVT